VKSAKHAARGMPVTEFKAHCLQHLEEVRRQGCALTLTRRGVPIAKVVPIQQAEPRSLRGMLAGRITFHGDIVHTDLGDWESVR
jgi:prevent-host-death family protein